MAYTEKQVVKRAAKRLKNLGKKKPSAGLSKKQKSAVVKKARAGKDIGKKGKNFAKVAAKAAASGATNPEAVAAAALWRNIRRGK